MSTFINLVFNLTKFYLNVSLINPGEKSVCIASLLLFGIRPIERMTTEVCLNAFSGALPKELRKIM